MPDDLYEVEFKGGRRELFLNPQNLPINVGDFVIVQADRGEDIGRVVCNRALTSKKKSGRRGREILRLTTEEEIGSLREKAQREKDAFLICRMKIAEHGLKMKLVDVEYQFDGNKICFFFTADKRIDFRELVKDLAAIYQTRIDMRQIGVRDEARRIGGHGPCGRELCCTTFITDFDPISSQMAKDQHLSLSPNKISGVCGRLMCCLLYEEDFYKDAERRLPKVGTRISSERGRCEVCKTDIFHDCVYLRYEDGTEEKKSLEEVEGMRKSFRSLFGRQRKESANRSRGGLLGLGEGRAD